MPPHSIKMPHLTAGHWALSLRYRYLVGLWLDSYAPGPYGGLISGYRNQHAEPDLIVQTHRLLQRVDVLRLFHISARPLTGRRTKPSILPILLNGPRCLAGRLPRKRYYSAWRAVWQAHMFQLFAFRFAFRLSSFIKDKCIFLYKLLLLVIGVFYVNG